MVRHDAEDVYQDVCISIRDSINRFKLLSGRKSFRPWLWIIVRCRIADFYEKNTSQLSAGGNAASVALPEESPEDLDERQRWIIRGLDEVRRRVSERAFLYFERSYRDRWTVAEIAEHYGVKPSTVWRSNSRLRAMLRSILGDAPPESDES